MLMTYTHFYKRSLFLAGNTVLTMLRSMNQVAREPSFVNLEPNFSKLVPELMMDLSRIQANESHKTRLYPVRKLFVTSLSGQIGNGDFLLGEEWDNSMYTSNSNLQVFYSSKNRYLLLNLIMLEAMLLNKKQRTYACQQETFTGLLGEIVLEHPKNEEPAPHLSFAVMVLYRLLR